MFITKRVFQNKKNSPKKNQNNKIMCVEEVGILF
jgi:hypothetical protein